MRLTRSSSLPANRLPLAIGHGAAARRAGERDQDRRHMRPSPAVPGVIGAELCPGVADYIALVNQKGGVLGQKLDYTELESGLHGAAGGGGL